MKYPVESYLNARKNYKGLYQVFWIGSRNLADINGKLFTKEFSTAKEARTAFLIAWLKEKQKMDNPKGKQIGKSKTINLKCGHKLRVAEWPSKEGLAKVRHHYKTKHPVAMKGITKKAIATKRARGIIENPKPKICKNVPKGAVEIYDNILSIEAEKGNKSLWPNKKFRHDFKEEKGKAKIYGLPDGSLLIKGTKKLWKKFEYD